MEGNLFVRGTTYYGRVWVRGREHRGSLRTTDESVARERLEAWRAELEAKVADNTPTWKKAVVVWSQTVLSGALGDGLKPRVQQRYLDSVRFAGQFFGDLKLPDVDRRAIAAYVRARKAGFDYVEADGSRRAIRPVTNATVRRDLTAISSVFRAAVAAGLADTNPAKDWDRSVIKERRKIIVPPTLDEIETVRAHASGAFARLIEFAAHTGVRLEEAVGIEWSDLRLDRGEVLLPRTKVSRPRVIKLQTPGGDATGSLTGSARFGTVPLVFWHGDGERYVNGSGSFRECMWKAIRSEAAQNRALRRFRFHDLRHAFATRWLLAGGDIYALSRHLGHTSVKTTEIYLAYVSEYRETADRIRDRITSSGPSAQEVDDLVAEPA